MKNVIVDVLNISIKDEKDDTDDTDLLERLGFSDDRKLIMQ